MKVLYVEGIAIYDGSESCVDVREDMGEALTGGCVGQPLRRVIHAPCLKARVVWGAETVGVSRRPHWGNRFSEVVLDPTRSKTLCTHPNTLFGNREIPWSSAACCKASEAERIDKPMGVQR